MKNSGVITCGAIADRDRRRMADVIESGFSQNLAPIISDRSDRLRVLVDGVNLSAVIGAYVDGELRGVIGLKRSSASVFDNMTFSLLRRVLGAGSVKAGLARRLVDRPLEPDTMRIEFLAVEKRARGSGVGRALLRAAECDACTKHITHIELHVEPENRGARALYESEGFHEAPAVRDSAPRRWFLSQADIRMTKESQCTTC